jgi:transcriptional regulator with GAF, ATPase, and Fis domain
MDDHEAWLGAALIDLSDSLDLRESAYLTILAQRLSEFFAPSEVGLLVTTDTGSLNVPAASSVRMENLMGFESRHKEGPCTTCHGTGMQLQAQTLAAVDDRWPRFGPAARSAGFAAVSGYPLRRGTETYGAFSVLDPTPRSANQHELQLVAILADAASLGLSQQRSYRHSQRRVEQLQRALRSRVVIEQAKGIVASWRMISPGAAFEILRGHACHHRNRLTAVAEDIVHGRLTSDQLTPRDGALPSGAEHAERRA